MNYVDGFVIAVEKMWPVSYYPRHSIKNIFIFFIFSIICLESNANNSSPEINNSFFSNVKSTEIAKRVVIGGASCAGWRSEAILVTGGVIFQVGINDNADCTFRTLKLLMGDDEYPLIGLNTSFVKGSEDSFKFGKNDGLIFFKTNKELTRKDLSDKTIGIFENECRGYNCYSDLWILENNQYLSVNLLTQNGAEIGQCQFKYPFNDDFVSMGGKIENFFSWQGECVNGKINGIGTLGIATYDKKGKTNRVIEKTYPNIQFSNGTQSGQLSISVSEKKLTGIAENFYFPNFFELTWTECTENVLFIFCKSAISYKEKRVWQQGIAAPWQWKKSSVLCEENQTAEQCKWYNKNKTWAFSKIEQLSNDSKCGELQKFIVDYEKNSGFAGNNFIATCQMEAAFKLIKIGKDPQKIFLAAGQYEVKGDRAKAKSLYNIIIEKFPKSQVAIHSANRLTRLTDVELIETSNRDMANRTDAAVHELRSENFKQCQDNRNTCWRQCSNIKNSSARSGCEQGCPLCSQ